MRSIDRLLLRFRSLFSRLRVEHELDAELRFHLQQQIDENLTAGMTLEEASCAAVTILGFVDAALIKPLPYRDRIERRFHPEYRHWRGTSAGHARELRLLPYSRCLLTRIRLPGLRSWFGLRRVKRRCSHRWLLPFMGSTHSSLSPNRRP